MRVFTRNICLFIVLVACSVNVFAQQSDYQIKTDFQEQLTTIENSLDKADTASEIDSLLSSINNLEQDFSEHSELLDDALYPETFSGNIEKLRKEAQSAQNRLLIIENQDERLDELTMEVSSFKDEVARLYDRSDSLRKEIAQSQDSEARLSNLVQRYRENMEQRDRFILDVVDSLLIAYKDMSPESVNELSEQVESGEISSEQNPLIIINTIIDENIESLKSSADALATEDYLRMYAVQNRFSVAWNQIGDGLVRIYGGDERGKWVSTIQNKLEDWKASASLNMWTSLDNYMEQNELDLAAFDNNYSFYVALDNFVKNSTKSSKEQIITSENYDEFQKFNEFWNSKIKSEWSKYVQEGEVLTMNQISSIDSEMVSWRDESKPRSFLIPILLGISVLAIIGLLIMLFKRS